MREHSHFDDMFDGRELGAVQRVCAVDFDPGRTADALKHFENGAGNASFTPLEERISSITGKTRSNLTEWWWKVDDLRDPVSDSIDEGRGPFQDSMEAIENFVKENPNLDRAAIDRFVRDNFISPEVGIGEIGVQAAGEVLGTEERVVTKGEDEALSGLTDELTSIYAPPPPPKKPAPSTPPTPPAEPRDDATPPAPPTEGPTPPAPAPASPAPTPPATQD